MILRMPSAATRFMAATIATPLIVSLSIALSHGQPPEPFDYGECLVTGKGTSIDARAPYGSYGRQDTRSWREAECRNAGERYKLELRGYQESLKRNRERKEREEKDRREMEEWNRRAAEASKSLPRALVQPTFVEVNPRLSRDRAALTLLDEVREPADKRQPEIMLGGDPTTKSRFVRISGKGVVPPAVIQIICGSTPRSLSLTASSKNGEINSGTYEVPTEVAATVIGSQSCYLALGGALAPLPRDLTAVVWTQ